MHHGGHSHLPTWQIGLSLMAGFALMVALDLLATHHHHHGSDSEHECSSKDVQHGGRRNEEEGDSDQPSEERTRRSSNDRMAAAWGLLLHAVMDGVALGVACVSASLNSEGAGEEDYRISNIMLIAIMLHKAPAAFGLTTMVSPTPTEMDAPQGNQSHGTGRQVCSFGNMLIKLRDKTLLRSILLFSAAAPVGSVVAYFLVWLFASDSSGYFSQQWLAHAFLFAAGTFLHVATTHALPEAFAEGHGNSGNAPSMVVRESGKGESGYTDTGNQVTEQEEVSADSEKQTSHLEIRSPVGKKYGRGQTPITPDDRHSDTEEERLLDDEDRSDSKDSKVSDGGVKRRIRIAYESGSWCAIFPKHLRQKVKPCWDKVSSYLPQSKRSTELTVLYIGMGLPFILSQVAGHGH